MRDCGTGPGRAPRAAAPAGCPRPTSRRPSGAASGRRASPAPPPAAASAPPAGSAAPRAAGSPPSLPAASGDRGGRWCGNNAMESIESAPGVVPGKFLHSCIPAFLHCCIAALLHCCIPPFGHACSGDRARACGRPNAVPPTREVDFFFFPRGGRRGMNWMEVPSAPGRALLELSLASSSPQAVAPCEPPRPSIHRTASRGHARPGVGASRRARGAPWRAGTHNT